MLKHPDHLVLVATVSIAATFAGAVLAVDGRIAFIGLGCAVALIVGLVHPALAIAALAALSPLDSVATSSTGGGVASPMKLFAVCAVTAIVVALLVDRRPTARWVIAASVIFGAWGIASIAWSADPSASQVGAPRLAIGLMICGVCAATLCRARERAIVLVGIAVGGVLAVALGLGAESESGRFLGATGDPNELGAFLLPALAIVVILARRSVGPRRLGLYATATILVASIAATGSRGALVGLVALATVMVIADLRGKGGREQWARSLGLGVAALAVVMMYFQTPLGQGLTDHALSVSDRGAGRTDLWRVSVEIVQDNPLLGVGVGAFPALAPRYGRAISLYRRDLVIEQPTVVHSTPLQIAVDLGLVGLCLFVALTLAALVAPLRTHDDDGRFPARTDVLLATIPLVVASLFISAQYEKLYWILIGVGLSYWVSARRA